MVGNTMNKLKPKIFDEAISLDYVLAGDYYVPAIELPEDDDRPIGKWGRIHRVYPEETNPLLLNHLLLTDKLHTYLADLNKRAQSRSWCLVHQMAENESVAEDLKRQSQWERFDFSREQCP